MLKDQITEAFASRLKALSLARGSRGESTCAAKEKAESATEELRQKAGCESYEIS